MTFSNGNEISTAEMSLEEIGALLLEQSSDGKGGLFFVRMTQKEFDRLEKDDVSRGAIHTLASLMHRACSYKWMAHYWGRDLMFVSEDNAVPYREFINRYNKPASA